MRRRPHMDLITLDTAYGVHIFVKDWTKSKDPINTYFVVVCVVWHGTFSEGDRNYV